MPFLSLGFGLGALDSSLQVSNPRLTGNGSENLMLETSTMKLESCNLKRFTVCARVCRQA
jgi:hypothetical protein